MKRFRNVSGTQGNVPNTNTNTNTNKVRSELLRSSGAPRPIAEAQRAVLARIGRVLRDQNVPPLDRGLRSIVAQQVRNLLVGGWPGDEVEKVAAELALTYDRFHGHQSLLGLQRVMEIRDEDAQTERHKAFVDAERGPIADPRVAQLLGSNKRDPRRLPQNHRAAGDPCHICQGPPGVHVSFSNIPELEKEAMERMGRERELRQPLRKVGA